MLLLLLLFMENVDLEDIIIDTFFMWLLSAQPFTFIISSIPYNNIFKMVVLPHLAGEETEA